MTRELRVVGTPVTREDAAGSQSAAGTLTGETAGGGTRFLPLGSNRRGGRRG
jgi:hypothetical protein